MSSSAKGKQLAFPAQRATAAYREYDHPERQFLINEPLENLNLHDQLHAEMQGAFSGYLTFTASEALSVTPELFDRKTR